MYANSLKEPTTRTRDRSECVDAYLVFRSRIEQKDVFSATASSAVVNYLIHEGYEPPYMAFYCKDSELINSGTFPGSTHYWHTMLSWGWDKIRAYEELCWTGDNDELNEAMLMCVNDFREFVSAVVEQA